MVVANGQANAQPKKADSDTSEKPGAKTTDAKETEELPEGDDDVTADAPLPEPSAGEQFPAPVGKVGTERILAPRRWLSVGLDLAALARPSGADDVRYLPGLFWGGHVRAELNRYLGLRVYFTRGEHSVSLDPGALTPVAASQGNVTVSSIGARIEPTLQVEERARLFLGAGVAWSRLVAPELETQPRWRSFERSGVFLEWTAAAGAIFDVIEDRAGIVLSLQAGTTSNATGSAFDSAPAIDHNGLRARIGGLPISDTTYGATVGAEAIF
jgi:hypothetical protein